MTFHITTSSESVALDKGRGKLSLSVTNSSKSSVLARAAVLPEAGASPSWFRIDGEERALQGEESTSWTVHLDVPAGTPPGAHRFRVRVLDVDRSDDAFQDSFSIGFTVLP